MQRTLRKPGDTVHVLQSPPAGQPAAARPSAPVLRAVATAPPERLPAAQRPLRVLLVEDSPLLVQRITELVGDLPNVELSGTAASEADAIARLAQGNIDAVILDLQLNAGSGFGILRQLQRQAGGPRVVVFTNFAIGAYRESAFALGASHFLDKSRDYDRLPGVLKELSESFTTP